MFLTVDKSIVMKSKVWKVMNDESTVIVAVHMLNEVANLRQKEKLYEQLSNIDQTLFLLRDLNARLGENRNFPLLGDTKRKQ